MKKEINTNNEYLINIAGKSLPESKLKTAAIEYEQNTNSSDLKKLKEKIGSDLKKEKSDRNNTTKKR